MTHTVSIQTSRLSVRRSSRSGKVIVCLSLALAVLFSSSACKKNEAEIKPVVTVRTVLVQKTDLVETVESEATLYPVNQAAITPKIGAPVKRFYVNRGSRVKQGQLLALLENKDLSASVLESRGQQEQAQAAYSIATRASLPQEWKKAELDANASRQMLEVEEKLYSSRQELFRQGALPRRELDQTSVSLTEARNQQEVAQQRLNALHAVEKNDQLKSARGQLESARGKFMGALAQLHYSEVHSPISGTVAERPLYEGETAVAGVPMLVIVDSSKIIAKAHLAQEQAALVKVGDSATLTLPGGQNPVAGKVTVVSPAVDANSTTIEVWVQAENPDGKLHPGGSAYLSIAVLKIPAALSVPSGSVLSPAEGGTSVMVVGKDSVARLREVKTGIHQGDSIQIVEGLKAGDTVVSSGAYGLPDGTQIQPAEVQPAVGQRPESDVAGAEKAD